tara:strand:- start:737 stop:922 length:186 start_codon:yes stop_codon:yes gene_type:complete
MKHTLKTFIAEQVQQIGLEDSQGKYLSEQYIIDNFDEVLKMLDKEEIGEMIIDFTGIELTN